MGWIWEQLVQDGEQRVLHAAKLLSRESRLRTRLELREAIEELRTIREQVRGAAACQAAPVRGWKILV